jgi:hypothetical protein
VSKKDDDLILIGTTCHAEHEKYKVPCQKTSCRFWQKTDASQNCIMIAAREGERTLQEIGDIFGVTRMRICQIEKLIFKKLLSKTDLEL